MPKGLKNYLLPNVEVVEIDVTSDQSVRSAFRQVFDKYGRIDVPVNNAGVTGFGLMEGYSIDQIKSMFETNFYGVIRTYRAVLPSMRLAKKRTYYQHYFRGQWSYVAIHDSVFGVQIRR